MAVPLEEYIANNDRRQFLSKKVDLNLLLHLALLVVSSSPAVSKNIPVFDLVTVS